MTHSLEHESNRMTPCFTFSSRLSQIDLGHAFSLHLLTDAHHCSRQCGVQNITTVQFLSSWVFPYSVMCESCKWQQNLCLCSFSHCLKDRTDVQPGGIIVAKILKWFSAIWFRAASLSFLLFQSSDPPLGSPGPFS